MYVCVPLRMPGTKEALDPMQPGLQIVVSFSVSARIQTLVL